MNNNNFDYINYVYGMPINTSYMMPNSINKMDNYNLPNKINEVNTNDLSLEINPYLGFVRGNLFNSLYEPYKNYKPAELNPTNEKETLLDQILQYNFALTDLDLYLDIHPNDSKMIKLYNQYLDMKNKMVEEYEKQYGNLSLSSKNMSESTWEWKNSPWPWEVN